MARLSWECPISYPYRAAAFNTFWHFFVDKFGLFKVTFQRSATTIPGTVGSPIFLNDAPFREKSRVFVVCRSKYDPREVVIAGKPHIALKALQVSFKTLWYHLVPGYGIQRGITGARHWYLVDRSSRGAAIRRRTSLQ